MSKFLYRINLNKLGVSKYFQFNKEFRDLIQKEEKTMNKNKRKMSEGELTFSNDSDYQ